MLKVAAIAILSVTALVASAKEPEESWPTFSGTVIAYERSWDGIHGSMSPLSQAMVLPIGTSIHKNYIDQSDSMVAGITKSLQAKGLYDVKLVLPADIDTITVGASQGGVRFASFLRGCKLHFTATTNTILGSWADPTFDVTFDVKLMIDLRLGPSTTPQNYNDGRGHVTVVQPIALQSVKAYPFNVVAKTDNVLVPIAQALNQVDLGAYFPSTIGVDSKPLSKALSSIVPMLQQAASQGYTSLESEIDHPSAPSTNVNIILTKSTIPISGNGTISGKVTWSRDQGYPGYGDTSSYSWAVMPPFLEQFPLIQVAMPYTSYVPNGKPLSNYLVVGYYSATVPNLGQTGTFEVDYQMTGLPFDVPLYVTIADSRNYPAWTHSNIKSTPLTARNVYPKVFEAVGWQGFVTIFNPSSQRAVLAPGIQPGGINPGKRPPNRMIQTLLTNPNGYGLVSGIDWTWHFQEVLAPGMTPIRLLAPGEAVQRFGSNMGNTTRAGG